MRPGINAIHMAIGSIVWAVCVCLAGVDLVYALVRLA
jgi:hypothetical protein